MEHLLLKAATTAATDQGTFEAVISTASIDRDGDIVEPTAIVSALRKWADLNKLMPLAWNHTDEVIGHIEPASARVEGKEVVATGWIDQTLEKGQQAWRLVKSGTLSFSYGMLVPKGGATKRVGATSGLHITELDLFEVSVIPVGPANNDTRVLGWKAAVTNMSPVDLLRGMLQMAQAYIDNAPDAEDATEMRSIRDDIQELVADLDDAADTAEDAAGKAVDRKLTQDKAQETVDVTDKDASRSVDPLRKQAEQIALEHASGGLSLRKPPRRVTDPRPEPELSLDDLKKRMRDEVLSHLSGETI